MALVLCSPAHEWGLHTDSGYPHERLHCPHNLAFVLTLVWSRAVFVSSLCPACVHFQGDISLPCLPLCFLLPLKFSSVILAFFQVNEKKRTTRLMCLVAVGDAVVWTEESGWGIKPCLPFVITSSSPFVFFPKCPETTALLFIFCNGAAYLLWVIDFVPKPHFPVSFEL